MAVAAFPALTPSTRSWTPGQQPFSTFNSMAGREVRVLHGSTAVGQLLALSFSNITEAKGKQITDHFALARGSFDVFDLPAAVFGGMASYGHIKPTGNLWRYSAAPAVSYVAPGVVTVSVSLVAVPQ